MTPRYPERIDSPPGTPWLEPHVPCAHRGCLQHVSHPCEGCGRIAGAYACPDCAGPLLYGDGVAKCHACGYAECGCPTPPQRRPAAGADYSDLSGHLWPAPMERGPNDPQNRKLVYEIPDPAPPSITSEGPLPIVFGECDRCHAMIRYGSLLDGTLLDPGTLREHACPPTAAPAEGEDPPCALCNCPRSAHDVDGPQRGERGHACFYFSLTPLVGAPTEGGDPA